MLNYKRNIESVFFKTLIIIVFIYFGVYQNIVSQSIQFEHLTTRNGLTQNHINCIFQDNLGFIWIGTFNGLSRYDGYVFKNYYNEAYQKNSLSHQSVNVVFQDKKGTIWIGTEQGLNRYNKNENDFTRYYVFEKDSVISPENDINTIYEDKTGVLWVGFYGGGLKRFYPEKGKFETVPAIEKTGCKYVNAFYADKDGMFWIGSERKGLISYNPDQQAIKQYSKESNLSDSCIASITEDKSNNLWIGTWNGGLNKFNKKTGKIKVYNTMNNSKLESNSITSLAFDNAGFLWMATFGQGLLKFDTQQEVFTSFKHNEYDLKSLSHNVLWKIYKDHSGILWIGTYGGGLNKYSPANSKFEYFRTNKNKPNWLNNNFILACCEGADGSIFLGTFGGGVNRFDRTTRRFSYLLTENEFIERTVRCLFEDSEKRLWAGTDGGVFCFDKSLKSKKFYKLSGEADKIGSRSIYSITQDRDGNMWFGLWNGGLKRLTQSESHKQNPDEAVFETFGGTDFNNTTVWDIYEDSEGDLWIGASKSLYRLDKKSGKFDKFVPNLVKNKNSENFSISCFYEDVYQKKLWFGTLGNGVGSFSLQTQQFQFMFLKSTLAHDEVYNIAADRNNNLWVSSNHGLLRYDKKMKQFQAISIVKESENEEVNDRLWKLKSGEILIGGNKGFYIFDPEEFFENAYNPSIVFTDFKIFNKSIDDFDLSNEEISSRDINALDEIKLSYKQNFFAFEFASLDYRASENNKYQYMLQGHDANWISANARNRIATYANIEGGVYIFKVRGTNSDGIWSSKVKEIKVVISQPFYKTHIFKISMGIFGIILIFIVYKLRMVGFKEKLLEKDKSLAERELAFERNKFEVLNNELEKRLGKNERELAASILYIQDKDENLLALRSQLIVILEHARASLKPQIRALLKNIDQELKEKKGWNSFKENIDILQNDFVKRLAAEYPKLSQKDLKICSLIIMGKTNKDIAAQLNISVQSVEMSRYRIRKKINIDTKLSLNDFLVRF